MAKLAKAKPNYLSFRNKHILTLDQFSSSDLIYLFKTTEKLIKTINNPKSKDLLKGNLATLLFFEPSTRTFSSFSAAFKKLGGETIEILNPETNSSTSKGETFEDTIKVIENYSDLIILRHPTPGIVKKASDVSINTPIINAGDGIGEHPTQALQDLFTIYSKTNKLEDLVGVIVGDMVNGRTVHSLLKGFSKFNNNKIYLLSPKKLRLKNSDLLEYKKNGLVIIEIENYKNIPLKADFWYWTRVQKERFKSIKEYEKVKNKFILNNNLIKEKAGKKTIFMHPLPRVGEILPEVDSDPRALYLNEQLKNGLYIRMSLIALILGKIK